MEFILVIGLVLMCWSVAILDHTLREIRDALKEK